MSVEKSKGIVLPFSFLKLSFRTHSTKLYGSVNFRYVNFDCKSLHKLGLLGKLRPNSRKLQTNIFMDQGPAADFAVSISVETQPPKADSVEP